MFNNDLVGKGKPWGLKTSLLPWQRTIYNRYWNMIDRCENVKCRIYKHYGSKGIKCEFTSLSQYYNTLKKDPLWEDFKKHPDKYEIDKDIKCGHGSNYSPDTIMIVTKEENVREVAVRTGLGNSARKVELDNVVYSSVTEASIATGISKSSIELHADCKTTSQGYTYKNTWTDKQGATHIAKYI